jgi:protein-disulfide isomerase
MWTPLVRRRWPRALGAAFVLGAIAAACGAPADPPPSTPPAPAPPTTAAVTAAPAAGPAPEEPIPVPVTASDPTWGSADAPVTIVELADFECPFCEKARSTLEELKEAYGPDKLRVVWKNHPLPFHKNAAPAARAAHVVFAVSGNDGFWSAHHALFNRQRTLLDAASQLLDRARAARPDLAPALAAADEKLEEHAAFVKASGVLGTPTFLINGVALTGAKPYDQLAKIVDEQLQKADALVRSGVAPGKVYGELTRAQWSKLERTPPPDPAKETPVSRVPVGKSPVRGPADALVTVVLVTDLRCHSCTRTSRALAEAMESQKGKIRLVIKYARGPGKDASDSALQLAIEARAKKGDAAFWKAYDALLAETELNDAALERAAKAAGLAVPAAMKAALDHKHKGVIDADEEIFDEIGGTFVPTLYINGEWSLAYLGDSMPKKLEAAIAAAEKRVAEGTPRAKLYETIMASAQAPAADVRKQVPPPDKDTPGRGPASAKVLLQVFANFESYPSQTASSKLTEMENEFPGKLRIVFRHLPSPLQPGSPLAAEAAVEAFVQKGGAGFWKMAELMFAGRDRIDGFEKPALERYGASAGLDATKLAAALEQHTRRAAVTADLAIAKGAGIRETTILVNDMVSGPSSPRLRRLIRRALAESK